MVNEIIKKNGITFGITIGIIGTLITATIYAIDLSLFISWWIGVLSIAISLTLNIILLNKTKKDLNGVFSFKDAFTTYFISAVIGILISVIFNIILFNIIDPAAKDTLKELTLKFTLKMMQKFGTPATAINEALTKLKETDTFSPLELIKGSVWSIIFSAVFGLIMAAIFKSKTTQV